MPSSNPFIVGITGGSGSGKTLFVKQLLKNFDEDQICFLSQDNYYIAREKQPKDENNVSNFDTLQSIDFDAYVSDIEALKNGEIVSRQEYTYNNPDLTPNMLTFRPAPVIVIEGLFVLCHEQLAKMLDLKVYIEAKDHIRLKRRIIRDNTERGYDLNDVLYRYEKHVTPTFEKYIEPYRHEADIIIPNNRGFDAGLKVLTTHLKTKLTD